MGAVSASERLLVVYASMPDGDQVAPVGPKKGGGTVKARSIAWVAWSAWAVLVGLAIVLYAQTTEGPLGAWGPALALGAS